MKKKNNNKWKKNNISLNMFILLILLPVIIYFVAINLIYPRKYKDIVEQAASIYNVDPNLIYAVIKQESNFNKDAVSSAGAKGLMQIIDPTAKQMARRIDSIDDKNYDVFDPYTNIHIGTKYLSYLIKYFDGNYYLAIIAYNAGMGRVDTWLEAEYNEYTDYTKLLENIKYNETKTYFEKVLNYYNIYTKLYN
ncbi:MAG: lytic transglycosylase domain-containing protein [Clostridia bacterium]|nr:lytic transglycosylase domain-containing protein [Clostridia bacterium]